MVLFSVGLLHSGNQRLMRAIIRVYDRSKVARLFGHDLIDETGILFLKSKLRGINEDLCFSSTVPRNTHTLTHERKHTHRV